jgi:membrane-bound serine protease (ClpP class)
MRLVLKSRSWKNSTGREELMGEHGVVTTAVPAGGEGMIRIHGELWRASSKDGLPVGATVRVLRIAGLRLEVAPATTTAAAVGSTPSPDPQKVSNEY